MKKGFYAGGTVGVPTSIGGVGGGAYVDDDGIFTLKSITDRHVGQGLQRRLMRVAERRSHRNGFNWMISDTPDNIRSANNFIRGGYQLYRPGIPWAFAQTLYWRKFIGDADSLR